MIAAAAAAARKAAGNGASIVVVGDTPSDISAARANDLPVIAVATGHSSFDRLLEHTPEICAENLAALLATDSQNQPGNVQVGRNVEVGTNGQAASKAQP